MKRFIEYSSNTDITFNEWLNVLSTVEHDFLNEGFLDTVKLPAALRRIAKTLKDEFIQLKTILKVDLIDLVNAFKEPNIFKILKSVKFSLKSLYNLYMNAYRIITKGIFVVFEEINKSGIMQKIRKGTAKVDDLLLKYPIIKKLTGPVIAGLLLYMWLNMSFSGSFDFDMNLSDMVSALSGNYSLEKLFTTSEGNTLLLLFATGVASGGALSFVWLGKAPLNLLMALVYTGIKNISPTNQVLVKIKSMVNK